MNKHIKQKLKEVVMLKMMILTDNPGALGPHETERKRKDGVGVFMGTRISSLLTHKCDRGYK